MRKKQKVVMTKPELPVIFNLYFVPITAPMSQFDPIRSVLSNLFGSAALVRACLVSCCIVLPSALEPVESQLFCGVGSVISYRPPGFRLWLYNYGAEITFLRNILLYCSQCRAGRASP